MDSQDQSQAGGWVAYKRLSEVPSDELASRLVTALIMQKGNLNQYDAVLRRFIENMRAEAAEERAELLEASQAFLAAAMLGVDPSIPVARAALEAAVSKSLGQ